MLPNFFHTQHLTITRKMFSITSQTYNGTQKLDW
jgi:hypothetical protein